MGSQRIAYLKRKDPDTVLDQREMEMRPPPLTSMARISAGRGARLN